MHCGISYACCPSCCSAAGGQRLWDLVLVFLLVFSFLLSMMKGQCPFLHRDCVRLLVCGAGSARAPASSVRLPAFLSLLFYYHGAFAWCGALSLRRVRWDVVELRAVARCCSCCYRTLLLSSSGWSSLRRLPEPFQMGGPRGARNPSTTVRGEPACTVWAARPQTRGVVTGTRGLLRIPPRANL